MNETSTSSAPAPHDPLDFETVTFLILALLSSASVLYFFAA